VVVFEIAGNRARFQAKAIAFPVVRLSGHAERAALWPISVAAALSAARREARISQDAQPGAAHRAAATAASNARRAMHLTLALSSQS